VKYIVLPADAEVVNRLRNEAIIFREYIEKLDRDSTKTSGVSGKSVGIQERNGVGFEKTNVT
jgi:hypothetical protein